MAKNQEKKSTLNLLAITILVVVILVILAVVYFTSVPGGPNGTPYGTVCVGKSGFVCSNYTYGHTTGNLTLSIEQATGQNWLTTKILFVSDNLNYSNVANLSWNSSNVVEISGGLKEYNIRYVSIPISGPVPVGTTHAGQLWAKYQLIPNGTFQYESVAQVDLDAS